MLGCVDSGDASSPDGIDDRGIDGKADGSQLSECQTKQILELLNGGISAADLEGKGVHQRAAKELVAHRDGADARFGTADDDKFDAIDEVDEVAYVGRVAFEQLAKAVAVRCAPDPYGEARDVTKAVIPKAATSTSAAPSSGRSGAAGTTRRTASKKAPTPAGSACRRRRSVSKRS
jgi:hypothetical protein